MPIKNIGFVDELTLQDGETPYQGPKRPLMIASSGGQGHIEAIHGIESYLRNRYKTIEFNLYKPGKPPHSKNPAGKEIRFASRLSNSEGRISKPLTTRLIKPIIHLSPIPVLPPLSALNKEIHSLAASKKRYYIDILQDIDHAGFESAAIWNIQQRNGCIKDLMKMITWQHKSDKLNHKRVKSFLMRTFENALHSGNPYTEVISTQALSLPAICEVIKDYNCKHEGKNIPQILLHQYLTDLPTEGAIHYFGPLSRIKHDDRQYMILYGVGCTKRVLKHSLSTDLSEFKAIIDIPAHKNPMVRPAFKDGTICLHTYTDKDCMIKYTDYEYKIPQSIELNSVSKVYIKANETVASIMLGSQASNDSSDYVRLLLEAEFDKIFVFGGLNENIYPQIDRVINQIVSNLDETKTSSLSTIRDTINKRVIRLGKQKAKYLVPILTRSNKVIIRSGGLSVMEQMAMPHHIQQIIFIHYPVTRHHKHQFSSGLSWENDNATQLVQTLNQRGIAAQKTTLEHFSFHLSRANKITHIKQYTDESHLTAHQQLTRLDDKTLSAIYNTIRTLPETEKIDFIVDILTHKQKINALSALLETTPQTIPEKMILTFLQEERLLSIVNQSKKHADFVLLLLSTLEEVEISLNTLNDYIRVLCQLYLTNDCGRLSTHFTANELNLIKQAFYKSIFNQFDWYHLFCFSLKSRRPFKYLFRSSNA